MITISQKALERLSLLLKNNNKKWIKLNIKGSGCAGFSYSFEFVDEKKEWDIEVENILLVDEVFYFSLEGDVDYLENEFESKLTLNVKNKTSSCGCGKSFAI